MNEVNGAYVAGTEVSPDQPSTARKTKTATSAARIVKAAERARAANVRSPRRLVVGAVSEPAFSGETVAVTWCSLKGGGYDGPVAPTAVPAWLGQLAEIFDTIAVAFVDSAAVSGADPAAFAAAAWP